MTVNNELIELGTTMFSNGKAQIWFPSHMMPTTMQTTIPDEKDLYDDSSLQEYPLGTKLVFADAIYRYVRGGAAVAAGQQGFLRGNYIQIPGKAGNSASSGYEGAPYAAIAAGATSFSITDTASTKNMFEGGYLAVYNDTDSDYECHHIIGNDASDGTSCKLYIASPGFKNDITTAMGITVYLSPYYGIRTVTGGYMSALGWAKMATSSGYFYWLQTAGQISGITGASTWPGQTQYYRDVYCNTDGSLITYTAGYQKVGYLLGRTASDYGDNFIMLQLDQ
jgi:hypothetical protein